MAPIKLDDQTICSTSSGVQVNNVVVSEAIPYGYNSSTGVLTLPNNNRALMQPIWANVPALDTNSLGWTQPNGLADSIHKLVHSEGSVAQKSTSFEDNGAGEEVIHSQITVPENTRPRDYLNAAGFLNRKYPDSKRYLFFSEEKGRMTQVWNTTTQEWRPLLQNTNTLIVNGKNFSTLQPNVPAFFGKLSEAYAYLNSLAPYTGVPPASVGPKAPSQDNIWTVLIFGRVSDDQINAQDYVNVIFMPGGRLDINCVTCTTASVIFDGNASAPVRYTPNQFSAIWTSAERSSFSHYMSSSYPWQWYGNTSFQIVGVIPDNTSVISISDMQQMTLSGISIYCLPSSLISGTPNVNGISISGALQLASNTRARNVTLKDVTVIIGSQSATPTSSSSAMLVAHTSGNVHLDDCVIACDPTSTVYHDALRVAPPSASNQASLHINECFVAGANTREGYALIVSYTSPNKLFVYGYNSVFEAYGQDSDGARATALYAFAQCEFSKCVFRVPRKNSSSTGYDPLNGLNASSPCAYLEIQDGHSAIFHECYFLGEGTASTGVTLQNNGTWADTKVQLNKCSVRGVLGSIVSRTGTTGTTKRFYGSSFEGPIAGTPFGCAAATATLATNYRV